MCRAPPLFGSTNTISRFGESFRDGQYSFVGFSFAILLLTLTVPLRPTNVSSFNLDFGTHTPVVDFEI